MEELTHLSYSSLQLYAECRHSWFGHYVLGRESKPTAVMILGRAVDEALSESSRHRQETGQYLAPEVVTAIFHEAFDHDIPEDAGQPRSLLAPLSPFWRGEEKETMVKQGDQLILVYFTKEWATEDEADFVPLRSAAMIQPEAVQRRVELALPGEYVQKLVGILDLEDETGVVVDWKVRKRSSSWDGMDFDLQPTTYAALRGEPTLLQFIELIRGDRGVSIKAHTTTRTQQDIDWFLAYVQHTARDIDRSLKQLYAEMGDIALWRDDPEAVAHAASAFPPSPGRRCMYDGHFIDCKYRAGALEGIEE